MLSIGRATRSSSWSGIGAIMFGIGPVLLFEVEWPEVLGVELVEIGGEDDVEV
jgi:hypothetical protein